ncbi:MAG: HEAT repeat domain-containing protein, partial [Oscillochloris sp.]|nr:HEAT repeat domain-containing protein [Oscillochloris sp.]
LEATGLIARYALNDQGGTIARIIALRLIARRPGGVALLQRFLAADHIPTPLRAAAARLLGMTGDVTIAPHLRRTMLNDGPPIVRRAAVDALAALAQTPGGKDGAVASLIDAIARPEIDATLTCHIATALGAAGATMAILALSTLLDPSRPAALRANWIAAVPELAHTPITQWATLPLRPHVRMILIDSLATGDTVADQPSSLDELAIRQAEQSATAAADSLARIAQQRPDLADDLCSRIRRTIVHTPWPHPPVGLLAALGRAAGEHSTDEIEQILNSPASTPALRWATLDQLGRNPAAIGWLQNRLYTGNDNVFIQGLIATLLGDLAAQEAVPTLRAITIDPVSDPRLREQTIVALGKIGNSEASIALLTLIKESSVPASLRAAAIDALSHPLSDTAYRTLRQIARTEGGVPTLASAVSRRLARAGEREILPLLLRNAQSDQAEEAISAIEAIVHLGDQSAISLLVRISQSVTAAPSVRLTAIAALIQIEGATHLPLLRSYLDSPISPIRLHAHQILAQTEPSNATLVEPLADMDAPLALRLAAMDRMIAQSPDLNLIAAILSNSEESPQLRLNSTTALADSGDPETIYALLDVLGTDSPPVLLHRCIAALGTLATTPGETGSIAQAGLVALAQASDSPAEICHWATQIILDHTFQEHIL